MEKPADNNHPIHDLLAKRWSPLAFADRPVERSALLSLLEAARWSPSSYNEQPWRFLLATKNDPENFAKALSCLTEGNQPWAQNAPVLLLTLASTKFERNGKPNRHAFHDVGLAIGSLTLQATELGLVLHQMAGIIPDKVRVAFGVPESFDPVTAIAIGYPGDAGQLPPELQKRESSPRARRPLESFVFGGRFDEPSSVVSG
ncbi:FMN reductase [NAD(P)H] [Planctomycetes bacterium Pan216]|uniref:FMN reductase [NAD(P)H] n=1 Tax=Kolteria novifilia TaxID=2527975 RepID=A0A518BA02_9BACT|nr:FMN reductase [NAD(P)H] [Planctomycetes bacterium Pan216]